jgi:hypothetical protein
MGEAAKLPKITTREERATDRRSEKAAPGGGSSLADAECAGAGEAGTIGQNYSARDVLIV